MTDVVVGATGVVGGRICQLLLEQGRPVRALVRATSSSEAVERLRTLGAEIVVGDLKSRASLEQALAGSHTVFSTASAIGAPKEGDSFETVDLEGMRTLIDVARAAGTQRIVYVSVLGIADDFPMGRAKRGVEEALRAGGVDYTIVQPSVFMDSWLAPEMGFDYHAGAVNIFGDGQARLGWVHSSDVARLAVAAAASPAARNATLHLTGPHALTPLEVVAEFEAATGRSFAVSHVPHEALAAQRAGAGNPWEETFAALMQRFAAGDPAQVTPLPAELDFPRTSVATFVRTLVSPS
jgi:uncharacterized protein YbjT (DUF2867 family)